MLLFVVVDVVVDAVGASDFGKLRDIEIMCQSPEEGIAMEDFVGQITKILYATEDDFVSVSGVVHGFPSCDAGAVAVCF